ncbi:hypothetical protein SprV_0200579200 [Sparganum proliferum]
MGEIGTNLLLQRVTEQASEQRVIRDLALVNKFRKLPNPTSSRNDKLVHNLSSKKLTKYHMQVLRHEASFNTADAKPVNMIAAAESILSQTEATEDTKSLIRHQVSSLLTAHRPREVLSKVERDALRVLKADKDLVIVPADQGRSTVVLDRTNYLQKAKETTQCDCHAVSAQRRAARLEEAQLRSRLLRSAASQQNEHCPLRVLKDASEEQQTTVKHASVLSIHAAL